MTKYPGVNPWLNTSPTFADSAGRSKTCVLSTLSPDCNRAVSLGVSPFAASKARCPSREVS